MSSRWRRNQVGFAVTVRSPLPRVIRRTSNQASSGFGDFRMKICLNTDTSIYNSGLNHINRKETTAK
ncbi:hypothetical protein C5Y93_24625 [Blastopirellula marina]|uniref:Uncharacterized protein n=1 Tax=Blastopirellula marina TaxID=124 RepID=A0A2S8GES2_9BACT|nr:hypothetical protein C5Y93_24625 [Blastopirellula marina]